MSILSTIGLFLPKKKEDANPLEKILQDVRAVDTHKNAAFEQSYAHKVPGGTEYHLPQKKKTISREAAWNHYEHVIYTQKKAGMTQEQLDVVKAYLPAYNKQHDAKRLFGGGLTTLLLGTMFYIASYASTLQPATGKESWLKGKGQQEIKLINDERDRKFSYNRSVGYVFGLVGLALVGCGIAERKRKLSN